MIILILIYLTIVTVTTSIFIGLWISNENCNKMFPDIHYIYNSTKMNMFGCVSCAILIFIFNPIVSLIWILYKITYFITHIGRKNN